MERFLKSSPGWRLGYNPHSEKYPGLVGSDDWAIELTEPELNDFCRLLSQLTETMTQMTQELMESEKIACEAETELLWMEVEGYPHSYSLRLILHQNRRCEGNWSASAVPQLAIAAQTLKIF